MQGGQSEVARLVAAINSEYAAAKLGLSGLAQGVSSHEFMTKRMENIAELHAKLSPLVDKETMEKITEQMGEEVEENPDQAGSATEHLDERGVERN